MSDLDPVDDAYESMKMLSKGADTMATAILRMTNSKYDFNIHRNDNVGWWMKKNGIHIGVHLMNLNREPCIELNLNSCEKIKKLSLLITVDQLMDEIMKMYDSAAGTADRVKTESYRPTFRRVR